MSDLADKLGEFALMSLIILLGAGAFGLFVWMIAGSILSNGTTDYCYVEMYSPSPMAPQYSLQGHRPWRTDRNMGVFVTLEEAKAKADALGCKLNSP
jgi:hypothetical protein